MMSFENIRIGVDVEVLRQGYLVSGKVRWKGQIPDKNGNWVGVELNDRVGNHSGLYRGVKYFQCTDGYGIFVRASQLRFTPSKGRSRNVYKSLSKISFVDESLFRRNGETTPGDSHLKPAYIPQMYVASAKSLFNDSSFSLSERKYFPLRHPIGSTRKLSKTGGADGYNSSSLFNLGQDDQGFKSGYEKKNRSSCVRNQLISSPSIPLINDPRKTVKLCW